MPTIVFSPNRTTTPPFRANVVLDGASYGLAVTWQFYAQRWYVAITNQSGVAWAGPLVASQPGVIVPLAPGIFASSVISFDDASNSFVITP